MFVCICDYPAWLLLPPSGQNKTPILMHPICLKFQFQQLCSLSHKDLPLVYLYCRFRAQISRCLGLKVMAALGSFLPLTSWPFLQHLFVGFYFLCWIFSQFPSSTLNICFKGSWSHVYWCSPAAAHRDRKLPFWSEVPSFTLKSM